MDWLTFISEIVKAIAWPGCVVALVCILRPSLGSLLCAVRRLTYKDLEVKFSEDLDEAEIEAESSNLPSSDEVEKVVVGVLEPAVDKYRRLAEVSPGVAVVEAWRDVELALRAAAAEYDDRVGRGPSIVLIISYLVDRGRLDEDSQRFLAHLRQLRNQVSHVADVALNEKDALRYARLANRVVASLKGG